MAWGVWGEVVLAGVVLRVVGWGGFDSVFLVFVGGDYSAVIKVVVVVVVSAVVAAFLDGVAVALKHVPDVVSGDVVDEGSAPG